MRVARQRERIGTPAIVITRGVDIAVRPERNAVTSLPGCGAVDEVNDNING
jgi:hypothetical protein